MTTKIIDDDQNTNLHYAASRGDYEVLNNLEDGQKVDPANFLGWTPLMMAARNGHLNTVKFLIKKGGDATKKNDFGATVFMLAIAGGNLELVQFIMEHLLCGGVSKQSMEMIFSPLSFAILFDNENIFKYLLGKNFSVNAIENETRFTPLMYAAMSENKYFYNVLLAKGADLTVQNIKGETAENILNKEHGVNYQQARNQCLQHNPIINNCPPFVVFSSQPLMPYMPPNSYSTFIRKSSNIESPSVFSPNLTPVPMSLGQQVFFPPDFSATQFLSPINCSFLNTRINEDMILSPIIHFNIPSPLYY